MFGLPVLVLSPYAGRLVDKRGSFAFIVIGMVLPAVTGILYTLMRDPSFAVPLILIEATGFAFLNPALYAVVAANSPPGRSSTAQGLFGAAGTLGFIIASVTTGILAEQSILLPVLFVQRRDDRDARDRHGRRRRPAPRPRAGTRAGHGTRDLMQVTVLGGAAWNRMIHVDRLPDGRTATVHPRWHHEAIGGAGAGKALNLARLGVDVTLYAGLGEDDAGARVRSGLGAAGVDLRAVVDPTGTAQHVNLMDPDGGRISLMLDQRVARTGVRRGGVGGVDGSPPTSSWSDLAPWTPRALHVARASGRPIWTDLHDFDGSSAWHAPFIDAAEVVFVSHDRLPDPSGFLRSLIERGKRLAVCTMGADGAIALDADGRVYRVPVVPDVRGGRYQRRRRCVLRRRALRGARGSAPRTGASLRRGRRGDGRHLDRTCVRGARRRGAASSDHLTVSGVVPIIRRRGVEQRQLVGLITRRSRVRIPSPQPIRLFREPRVPTNPGFNLCGIRSRAPVVARPVGRYLRARARPRSRPSTDPPSDAGWLVPSHRSTRRRSTHHLAPRPTGRTGRRALSLRTLGHWISTLGATPSTGITAARWSEPSGEKTLVTMRRVPSLDQTASPSEAVPGSWSTRTSPVPSAEMTCVRQTSLASIDPYRMREPSGDHEPVPTPPPVVGSTIVRIDERRRVDRVQACRPVIGAMADEEDLGAARWSERRASTLIPTSIVRMAPEPSLGMRSMVKSLSTKAVARICARRARSSTRRGTDRIHRAALG